MAGFASAAAAVASSALSAIGSLGSTAITALAPYGVEWIINKVKQGKGMSNTELHKLLSAIEQLKQDNIDMYNEKLSAIYPKLVASTGSETLNTQIDAHNAREKRRYEYNKNKLKRDYQSRAKQLATMSGEATGLAYSSDISNIGKMNQNIKNNLKEQLSNYEQTL